MKNTFLKCQILHPKRNNTVGLYKCSGSVLNTINLVHSCRDGDINVLHK